MIEFGVWAPDEETFWESWERAGICDDKRNLLPPYAGCIATTADTWTGLILDADGKPIPGWHCNVRVYGAVAELFTSGIEQHNADGDLLDVMERTEAIKTFGLERHDADKATGFPPGWRSSSGVTYTDARSFSTPACVWQ